MDTAEFEEFLAYSQKNLVFDDMKTDFFQDEAQLLGCIKQNNHQPEIDAQQKNTCIIHKFKDIPGIN